MLSTTMSACSRRSDGDSADATATRTRSSRPSTARKLSRSVVSSPATSARVSPASVEQLPHRRALVRVDGRQHLEQLAAEPRDETLRARLPGDRVELGHRRILVVPVAEVERDRQSLVLGLRRRPPRGPGERVDPLAPTLCLRVELEPVRADVDDSVDADARAHVVARPPADHADEPVAAGEPLAARRASPAAPPRPRAAPRSARARRRSRGTGPPSPARTRGAPPVRLRSRPRVVA